MILGADLGNGAGKTSNGILFPAKVSKIGNILSSNPFIFDNQAYYIGEGKFDTEYRKVKKEYIKVLFAYAVSQSTQDTSNRVVVGLPLSQYRQDKNELRELLISTRTKGVRIDDVAVYPEGVASIIGTSFEGIIIDIGALTTDIAMITDDSGIKKVHNPFSMAKGTINLYSDFIKIINAKYGLDLSLEDGDRIIHKGLFIDGQQADCSMAVEVFRSFVDELINVLRVEYSLRTNNVLLVGGGAELLYKPIVNRIPAARLVENPLFANARGFKRAGEMIWH